MNIFVLHGDIKTCAQYHVDKHVVKMIVEYAQLLSTAHRVLDGGNVNPIFLKATHINHPCAIWVRKTEENYCYLYSLLCELFCEYTYRYCKKHLYERNGLLAALNYLPMAIPKGSLTEIAQAMPEHCKNVDGIKAYRNYYVQHKQHLCQYKKRAVPKFWSQL